MKNKKRLGIKKLKNKSNLKQKGYFVLNENNQILNWKRKNYPVFLFKL